MVFENYVRKRNGKFCFSLLMFIYNFLLEGLIMTLLQYSYASALQEFLSQWEREHIVWSIFLKMKLFF